MSSILVPFPMIALSRSLLIFIALSRARGNNAKHLSLISFHILDISIYSDPN